MSVCPKCGSDQVICADERDEVFVPEDGSGEYSWLPVGYMLCGSCGQRWVENEWYGWDWVGTDERDAFGWDDG